MRAKDLECYQDFDGDDLLHCGHAIPEEWNKQMMAMGYFPMIAEPGYQKFIDGVGCVAVFPPYYRDTDLPTKWPWVFYIKDKAVGSVFGDPISAANAADTEIGNATQG